MVSPLEVDAMEGLGVSRLVAVIVVTMDPTRAGTIEVGSRPLPDKVLADFRIQITRAVGAAVDSGITHRGEPVLTNTMLAKMRLRAAVQPPPRQARPVRQQRSRKLRARNRSRFLHRS